MARQTLRGHRKMARLAQRIGDVAAARGHLELLWEVAHASGNPVVGDAHDVEVAACWRGAPGELVAALIEAGGAGRPGFLDAIDGGLYQVHDFWQHCPDFVKRRKLRDLERVSGVPERVIAEMERLGALDLSLPADGKALRKIASRKGFSRRSTTVNDGQRRLPTVNDGLPLPSPPLPKREKNKTVRRLTGAAAPDRPKPLTANQREIQAAEALYRDLGFEPPPAKVLVAMRKQAGGGEQLLACLRSIGAAGLRVGQEWVHGCCVRWGRGERKGINGSARHGSLAPDLEERIDAMEREDRERARERAPRVQVPG